MTITTPHETASAFARVLRATAEASLVVSLGFSAVVLLIGTPIALLVRALYEGLSWLSQSGGMTGPFIEALVAVASAAGGVTLFALAARTVVRCFWQRRESRLRMKNNVSTSEKLLDLHFAEANG